MNINKKRLYKTLNEFEIDKKQPSNTNLNIHLVTNKNFLKEINCY